MGVHPFKSQILIILRGIDLLRSVILVFLCARLIIFRFRHLDFFRVRVGQAAHLKAANHNDRFTVSAGMVEQDSHLVACRNIAHGIRRLPYPSGVGEIGRDQLCNPPLH